MVFGNPPGEGMIPGLNILWSLAVKEHFYLLFPLAYLAILGLSRRERGASWPRPAWSSWRGDACWCSDSGRPKRGRTRRPTRGSTRSSGGACWRSPPTPQGDRWGHRLTGWGRSAVAFVALVGCLVLRADWFRETFRYTIQGVALMPLFALAIRRWQSGPVRFLNLYLMRLLGVYSYTIYLVHHVIVHYLKATTPTAVVLNFPIVLGLSFALAALMYRFVDLPAAELRRKFSP